MIVNMAKHGILISVVKLSETQMKNIIEIVWVYMNNYTSKTL